MDKPVFSPAQLDAKGLLKLPKALWILLCWLLRYPLIWVGSLMGGASGGTFLSRFLPDFEHAWPWFLPALPAFCCLWLNGLRHVDSKDRFWWLWRQQGLLLKLGLIGDLALVIVAISHGHGRYDPWQAVQLAVSAWGVVYLFSSKYLPALWRDRPSL
ncbi:DUF2919 family protein [Gallaecimonas mangrovi]|uniref:DUF2919 family protein n=1 Tax=Gallaecimonas mangrovi TaxID=2291597 RepID=UPI000E20A941|nr:DUF2919 family protein [Gallaecimonas mangrovi]